MAQESQSKKREAEPADHELKNQGDKLQNAVDKVSSDKPSQETVAPDGKPSGLETRSGSSQSA